METDTLYKDFKLVTLKGSPSYQTNNLSTNGDYFVYAYNGDPMSKLFLFDHTVLKQTKKDETVNSFQLYKEFDYIVNTNYVKKEDKWNLVVC